MPSGGTDRVHRIVVGMNGKQVTEREVGSVAAGPADQQLGSRTNPIFTKPRTEPSSRRRWGRRRVAGADDGADAYAGRNGRRVYDLDDLLVGWGDIGGSCAALGILPSVSRVRIAEIVPVMERSVPTRGFESGSRSSWQMRLGASFRSPAGRPNRFLRTPGRHSCSGGSGTPYPECWCKLDRP